LAAARQSFSDSMIVLVPSLSFLAVLHEPLSICSANMPLPHTPFLEAANLSAYSVQLGETVGVAVGAAVGGAVGGAVGATVGSAVGAAVGAAVGDVGVHRRKYLTEEV